MFFLFVIIVGFVGVLFGYFVGYVINEIFDLVMLIIFLLMIVIGGLGFIYGVFFGVIVVGIIFVVIVNGCIFLFIMFDVNINVSGLESVFFVFIFVCFILFELMGFYG